MGDPGKSSTDVQPLRSWERENAAAIGMIVVMVGVWSFGVGVLNGRLMGIELTEIHGRVSTPIERHCFVGSPAAITSLLLLVLLLALTGPLRYRIRVGLLAALLLTVGTAADVLSVLWLDPIVHSQSWDGDDLTALLPGPIGLLSAWALWLGLLAFLERYRVAVRVCVLRRGAPAHSTCPHCAYDLSAGASATCPECGWTIPAGVLARAVKSGA